MIRKLYLVTIFFIMLPSLVLAQGRIRGQIIDRETGQPLPGANVNIVDTQLGAASDEDGNYLILAVPLGVVSVRATFIGYQSVTISNIRVAADYSSVVNFELPSEAIEVGAVVIVAERPLLNLTSTNAVRTVTQEDLVNSPTRGLAAAVQQQAGVVVQEGRIHIRGGRRDEVGFYIEGAVARNILSGVMEVNVIQEAIELFELQAGGFNAEYGEANAGIISASLRTGGNDFHMKLMAETDRFTPLHEKRFDTYSYGYDDVVATLSGPLGSDNIRFFIAGERQNFDDSARRFWPGFKFTDEGGDYKLKDGVSFSGPLSVSDFEPLAAGTTGVDFNTNGILDELPEDLNGNGRIDIFRDSGRRGGDKGEVVPGGVLKLDPGNINGVGNERWSTNGTIIFDAHPISLKLHGSASWRKTGSRGLPFRMIFNQDRVPETVESTGLWGAKLTHILNSKTFYQVGLNYFDNRQIRQDPVFKQDFLAYTDSGKIAAAGAERGQVWTSKSVSAPPQSFDIFGFPIWRPGAAVTNPNKFKQNYLGGTFDITTQISSHEIKAGGGWRKYTIRLWAPGSGFTGRSGGGGGALLEALLAEPTITGACDADASSDDCASEELRWGRGLFMQNYGYDVFGKENDVEGYEGPKNPVFANAYVQDKFEIGDLVVNIGLRLDRFELDDWKWNDTTIKDPITGEDITVPGYEAPCFDLATFNIGTDSDCLTPSDALVELSPRLGLSFPVSDRTVFHMQYGKFVQLPELSRLYNGPWRVAANFGGQNFISNPQAFDLDVEKTIQYEVGFGHQLTDNAAFDLSLFYRDESGKLQYRDVTVNPLITNAASYQRYVNGDFGTTKGFEFSLRIRRTERLSANINYTFSEALGTGSVPNSAVSSVQLFTPNPTVISPLTFNQRHVGTVNLDYRLGRNEGGVFKESGVNALFNFSSGHAYTKVFGDIGQRSIWEGGILADDDPRTRRPLEPINSSTTPSTFTLDVRFDKTIRFGNLNTNWYLIVQNVTNRKNILNVYGRTGVANDDGYFSDPLLSQATLDVEGPQYEEIYRAVNLDHRQHFWNTQGFSVAGANDLFGTPRQIRFGVRVDL